jgi:hypothetical protein
MPEAFGDAAVVAAVGTDSAPWSPRDDDEGDELQLIVWSQIDAS